MFKIDQDAVSTYVISKASTNLSHQLCAYWGGELRRGLCTNPGWTRWWTVHDSTTVFPKSSRIWDFHLDLRFSMQTHPILGLEVEKEFCLFRCFRIWLESRNWTESSYNLFNLFGETEGDQRSESLLCKMTTYDRFAVLLTRSTGVTPCGSILFPGYVFIGRWSLLLLHCQRGWWSVQE